MSSGHEWNSTVAGSDGRGRSSLAIVLVSLMLLSSVPLFAVPVSSDPWFIDDGDMSRNIRWNFTDPSDYSLTNTTVADDVCRLSLLNRTVGENTTADYERGVGTNLDISTIPNSMIIENTSLTVQTLRLQAGPEGKDTYIDEWFPTYTPKDSEGLVVNGEYDPAVTYNSRERIIMQFNLSAIPTGATIWNATLLLYETNSKAPLLNYTIHSVNASWVEPYPGVSWQTRDAMHSWNTFGGDYSTEIFSWGTIDASPGYHAFDITRLIDLWTRGVLTNYGLLIVANETVEDNTKNFGSCEANKVDQRPVLFINYTTGSTTASYQSTALGDGLNSTFTLASWEGGVQSKATDEFSDVLSPRWTWLSDPTDSGGSVMITTDGWLNVTGSSSSNPASGVNYLHQAIVGNFRAEASLTEWFQADSMGAGILLRLDNDNWLTLYKAGSGSLGTIVAEVSHPGNDTVLGSIAWTERSAILRVERVGTIYSMFASADGTGWTPVAGYSPHYDFTKRVQLGICVFSGGSPLRPVVQFDYARIDPLGQTGTLEVYARNGNSTVLSDPSWTGWTGPLVPSSGIMIDRRSMFTQYMVTMSTSYDWFSPSFSGFECHHERYEETGIAMTEDVSPLPFASWQSLEATQSVTNGLIEYAYSTDHGSSWVNLGSGSVFSIPIAEPSIMVRAALTTYDTLATPALDALELVYTISHSGFYVSAPQTVVAGQQFSVYVEPKDTLNNTADWSGTIQLVSLDASGLTNSSATLDVTTAVVPTGGHLTITNERYDVAETIRIAVSGSGASGVSAPITVIPGAADHIVLEPNITRLPEDNSTTFTAVGYDALGNLIADRPITWHADASLGFLNTTMGPSVILTTNMFVSGGFLNVTIEGVTLSRYIDVSPLRMAPQIDPSIPRNQTKPEDFGSWTFDISPYVSDREDNISQLKWYVVNNTKVLISGENRTGDMTITFSTIRNVFGAETIELRVVDTDRMMARVSINVNITPVNDAPWIDPIDPLIVRYEDPYAYNLEYYLHDVETALENLTITIDATNAPFVHMDGLWLTINYPESMNGTQQSILLTVSDGDLQAETYILVTVTDDYVPRTRGSLPDLVMHQGDIVLEYFDLDDFFTDPDGDVVIYAYGNTHVSVMIQPNNTVDFYAPTSWYGEEYVVFRASDSEGARAESAMTITVIAVNQPPVISGIPDILVRYGEEYVFDLRPYVSDLDDDQSTLTVTTSDPHVWAEGLTLTIMYPSGMTGLKVPVNITVGDGELYDYWIMNVSISADRPPVIAISLPDFSFYEDEPARYPEAGSVNDFFSDPDGDPLVIYAFTSSHNVTAAAEVSNGNWTVVLSPDLNWNGLARLTLRAVDGSGGLVEATVQLLVISVPDKPILTLPDTFSVTEGTHTILDITKSVQDPDSILADFRFVVGSDYADYVTIHNGVMVFEFPEGYLEDDEDSRTVTISITVFDQDNLFSADSISVTIYAAPHPTPSSNPLLWLALAATAAAAVVFFAFAVLRRKKPFVVRDMMVIHNDGFLITRLARPVPGEIDDQVLSGMLTAVLNFVEDSMAKKHDSLTTFGFREYQVMVHRGEKAFAAVVFEGDQPQGIEVKLGEFIEKFDRIYRKNLVDWTGDIETDFAGADVLIKAWVRENSRRGKEKKAEALWKTDAEHPPSPPEEASPPLG